MIDTQKIETLLLAKGVDQKTVAKVCQFLAEECPWLDTKEEISTEIGISMLDHSIKEHHDFFLDIIEFHNAEVLSSRAGEAESQALNYQILVNITEKFGKHDPFGDGEYWVVDDAFFGGEPTIIKFDKTPVSNEMKLALMDWLAVQNKIHSVSVIEEDGNVLWQSGSADSDVLE
jgi:hypothetical protein